MNALSVFVEVGRLMVALACFTISASASFRTLAAVRYAPPTSVRRHALEIHFSVPCASRTLMLNRTTHDLPRCSTVPRCILVPLSRGTRLLYVQVMYNSKPVL